MKVVTPLQMREIDDKAIRQAGIPGIVLMENAAIKVVAEITKHLGTVRGSRITLFAGGGNNGGDAFAVARHLHNMGAVTEVFTIAEKSEITGDAAINLEILNNIGIDVAIVTGVSGQDPAIRSIVHADAVVDGIFGTGLRGAVSGLTGVLIEKINSLAKYVISIDIPSGLNGNNGKVCGPCIKANKTVTFGFPKIGLLIHPGPQYTGELVIADIGIPSVISESVEIKINQTDESFVSYTIPKRQKESNKADFGKVLIIGGSKGMTGAACLAGRAALRSGAGLVYIAVPASIADVCSALVTEAIIVPLEDNGEGFISVKCLSQLDARLGQVSSVAVGPGLSLKGGVRDVVEYIVSNSKVPLILDADALNVIAGNKQILEKLRCEAVLTPHPGEMSRLTGINTCDVQNNRIDTACKFAEKWGAITVLKGAGTITAAPDGTVFINPTGNPGMATGGSGDVLTGVIASLAAQGISHVDAAVAGVFLHGLAGDMAAELKGVYGMIAGDIVEQLPNAIKGIVRS